MIGPPISRGIQVPPLPSPTMTPVPPARESTAATRVETWGKRPGNRKLGVWYVHFCLFTCGTPGTDRQHTPQQSHGKRATANWKMRGVSTINLKRRQRLRSKRALFDLFLGRTLQTSL